MREVFAQQPHKPELTDLSKQYPFHFESLGALVSLFVGPIFNIATIIVIFLFLFGAFKFLTSGGDKEAVASARNTITYAIIGFVLLIMVFLIMQFIPQFFGFDFKVVR